MTWVVVGLVVAVLAVVGWLMFGSIADRRDEEQARRRRSAEDRLRDREQRAERRRRLGLPDDEGRSR